MAPRTLVVPTLALLLASSAAAAEFTSGSEVVFTGGPSQPPQSRQTGLSVKVDLRGGGALIVPDAPPPPSPAPPDPGASPLSLRPLPGRSADDLAALTGDDDPSTRASALTALASLGRRDLVRDGLDDRDDRVAGHAARLLGGLKDRASVGKLIRLADLDRRPLEDAAVDALGAIGSPAARAALRRLADLGDAPVALRARKALRARQAP